MLVSKLHSGTSKTIQLVPVHLDLPLFWKSHCETCSPARVILYHVTGSCKGPIEGFKKLGFHRTYSYTSRYIADIRLVKLSNVFPQLTFNFASWFLSSTRQLAKTASFFFTNFLFLQDGLVKVGIIGCVDDKDLFKSWWSMRGQPTNMLSTGAKILCIWSYQLLSLLLLSTARKAYHYPVWSTTSKLSSSSIYLLNLMNSFS